MLKISFGLMPSALQERLFSNVEMHVHPSEIRSSNACCDIKLFEFRREKSLTSSYEFVSNPRINRPLAII